MNLTPTHLLRNTTLRDTLTGMMSRTNETGLETGIVLKQSGGKLYTTHIQTGSNGSITLRFGDGKPIATAHTHPSEQYESLFSPVDIRSYLNGPMRFAYLVYDDGNLTKADIYKTNEYDTYQGLLADVQGSGLPAVRSMNEELYRGTVTLGQW